MRDASASLRAKLDSPVSTFCTCWRLARRDGVVMGFTDHDRDIAFGGVTFSAATGLSASETESRLGFAVGGNETSGALDSAGIVEADVLAGAYDGAGVEIWLVDWSDPTDRLLLDVATIGEIRRSEFAFVAETRSGAHWFDQPQGRSFQRACSADLGDARCGVDLSRPGLAVDGVVAGLSGGVLAMDVSGLFASGFFAGGRLRFASGANAGSTFTVKSHLQDATRASIVLWSAPPRPVAAGDAVHLSAGCDKSPETCQARFRNIVNFRGFPHMPGNDRVIAYPSALAPTMDGGSFFK